MKPQLGWIYLGDDLEAIKSMAEERDNQKSKYKSTKNWSEQSTHFVGLCGEFVVSKATGIPIDTELKVDGDPGYDLLYEGKKYSIKTTTYWKHPHLKEYLSPKTWCDFYILVGLDVKNSRGIICGWCNRADMESAKIVDYGYGPQRSISGDKLKKW